MAPATTSTPKPRRPRRPPRGRPVRGFPRITIHPRRLGGVPCIRDHRFSVAQALRLLSAGQSEDEILRAFPFLEREDLREVLAYASSLADRPGDTAPAA